MSAGDRARKRVVVVRHAKSSWDDASLADHDRPLAPRGVKALRPLRQHLAELAPSPDLALCSSSRRTRDTLDGIRAALGDEVPIEIDDQLYGAEPEELLSRLRRIDDGTECVLLIGHNPGVADLVDLLVDRRDSADGAPRIDKFPTAAVAVLSFPGPWQGLEPASASLDSFWTPRQGEVVTGGG